MKKIVLVLIISVIVLNKLEAKKIEGYFITKSNDTVRVTFNIPTKPFSQELSYEGIQWKIKYYDSQNKKQSLSPDMATEISFTYEDKKIIFLSRINNLGLVGSVFQDNSRFFLQLIIDGKLKMFKYYHTTSSPGTYNVSTGMTTGGSSYSADKYILQKNDGELFKTRWLFFRKDMINYLSDCPDLVKKIEDTTYSDDDIEQIVNEYNTKCK